MFNARKNITKWGKKLDLQLIILGGILIWYIFYWGNIHSFVEEIDHCSILFCDFNNHYYPAGKAILTGGEFPNGFYYSTFAAIVFSPFAIFSPSDALFFWGIVQFSLVVLLYLTYKSQLPKISAVRYLFTFLFFTNVAVLHNFKWGQVSILLFMGTFFAFLFYKNNQWTLSAIVLGFTIAFKYFPAIFLIYFLFKKDWKYLILTILVVLIFLLLIPILILGFKETINDQFIIGSSTIEMIKFLATDNIDSQSFISVLTRVAPIPDIAEVRYLWVASGYLVVALGFYLVYKVAKIKSDLSIFWVWGILSATIPFWVPSTWPHYFVYLPFLQALTFCSISNIHLRLRTFAIFAWAVSLIFSSIFLVQIVHNWFKYVGYGSLFWSNLSISLLILIVLLPGYKQEQNFQAA